jgi:diacylglycerol kinase
VTLALKDKNKKGVGLSFAWNGVIEALKHERNFQIHIIATVLVVVSGVGLQLSILEWTTIILVIGMVLVTELVNSAIEMLIDYLKPEIHPQAKIIKDIAAGAVLVSAIVATIIGILIFFPKLIHFF